MRFNKCGKAREITLGGAILLLIAGIAFITQSGTDSTGLMLSIGLIFSLAGGVSLAGILVSYFR